MEEEFDIEVVFPVTVQQHDFLTFRVNSIRRKFKSVDDRLKDYVAAQLILESFWGDSALVTAGYVSEECVAIYNAAFQVDNIIKTFHENVLRDDLPWHKKVEEAMENKRGVPIEFKRLFDAATGEELVEVAIQIDEIFDECSKEGYKVLYLTNIIMLGNALKLYDMKLKGERQEQVDRDFQYAQTIQARPEMEEVIVAPRAGDEGETIFVRGLGRRVSVGGRAYNQLIEEGFRHGLDLTDEPVLIAPDEEEVVGQRANYIRNPRTGSRIRVGGLRYNQLIGEGFRDDNGPVLIEPEEEVEERVIEEGVGFGRAAWLAPAEEINFGEVEMAPEYVDFEGRLIRVGGRRYNQLVEQGVRLGEIEVARGVEFPDVDVEIAAEEEIAENFFDDADDFLEILNDANIPLQDLIIAPMDVGFPDVINFENQDINDYILNPIPENFEVGGGVFMESGRRLNFEWDRDVGRHIRVNDIDIVAIRSSENLIRSSENLTVYVIEDVLEVRERENGEERVERVIQYNGAEDMLNMLVAADPDFYNFRGLVIAPINESIRGIGIRLESYIVAGDDNQIMEMLREQGNVRYDEEGNPTHINSIRIITNIYYLDQRVFIVEGPIQGEDQEFDTEEDEEIQEMLNRQLEDDRREAFEEEEEFEVDEEFQEMLNRAIQDGLREAFEGAEDFLAMRNEANLPLQGFIIAPVNEALNGIEIDILDYYQRVIPIISNNQQFSMSTGRSIFLEWNEELQRHDRVNSVRILNIGQVGSLRVYIVDRVIFDEDFEGFLSREEAEDLIGNLDSSEEQEMGGFRFLFDPSPDQDVNEFTNERYVKDVTFAITSSFILLGGRRYLDLQRRGIQFGRSISADQRIQLEGGTLSIEELDL